MALQTWLLYLAACVGLSLSPGPNGLLALTHGALYGRARTLYTIAGGALGFVVVIGLSLFGIGALIKASLVWLALLKWAGGAYLVWLGWQLWRAPALDLDLHADAVQRSGAQLLRQGALSALANPKAVLFFSAFLPHFIDPQRSLAWQFVLLAATFVATEVATEFVLASAAQRVRRWLARVGRGFNRVCGGLFMVLGAALALRD